jgi:hypothetical protein
MSTPRFVRILFCVALLFAASIMPAASKTSGARRPVARPTNTKVTTCYDYGSWSRCCTSSGYCCVWSGAGSPTCGYQTP